MSGRRAAVGAAATAVVGIAAWAAAAAVGVVLGGAVRDGVAAPGVAAVAVMGAVAPWAAAAVVWNWRRHQRRSVRVILTSAAMALTSVFAIVVMIAAAVLGDQTGAGRL